MQFLLFLGFVFVVATSGQKSDLVQPFPRGEIPDYDEFNTLEHSDLVLVFAIFRHGDRTPDLDELDLYSQEDAASLFFPYGPKALTNKGKQRSYRVGEYLRRRYKGFLSPLYRSDEIAVRTTDYDRTKMTALCALAAMYPPLPAQRWNPILNWQPIPYDTMGYYDDDLLYWYNCPRYLWMRNKLYEVPEVKTKVWAFKQLFDFLSEKTKTPITKAEDVFYLDNLFQALINVNHKLPKWALDAHPSMRELTKLEFEIEFYNADMIRTATGVLLNDIRNYTRLAASGKKIFPKMRLYSAHENNVAALMAAIGVFKPHQPQYGATFIIELRKKQISGKYAIAVIYNQNGENMEEVLRIDGCEGKLLCDIDTFLSLTKEYAWTRQEYKQLCNVPV